MGEGEATEHLERGRAALARGSWGEARVRFEAAARSEASAEAYEGLSWACWWLNDAEALFAARERSYRLYRERGDSLGAARLAVWLSSDYSDFRGEAAVANGWLQRARRLLEDQPPAAEHGWLQLMEGDSALLAEEDTARARACAQRAAALGRDLGIPDIEALGVAMEGTALVSEGDLDAGMKRLDEAAAAAMAGEYRELFAVGWTLCYLIYACERARDYERAAQWCEKMRAFGDRLQFTLAQGVCRAHYGGVLVWRGKWPEAEQELSSATRFLQASRPPLVAEGLVRLGDLRRRQGRVLEAEDAFRQAEWHPLAMLGLAEMALDGGRPRDAEEFLQRLLRQVPQSSKTQRAAALELMARVKALLGEHEAAAEAAEAVRSLSQAITTLPLRASASFSGGVVAVASGEYDAARICFEDARDLFERAGAPYESARARLELASVLSALLRWERAREEANAALKVLKELGAAGHVERATTLLRRIADRDAAGRIPSSAPALTHRQVDVLRLVARGLGDREIAETLVISEHTVHRHVANILLRLDSPTRASAVAAAGRLGLL